MPRYFIHLHTAEGFIEDEEGSELPSLDIARDEAIAGVRSILSDEVKSGRIDLRSRLEITDAAGVVLLTLRFAEAVTLISETPQ